MERRCVFTFVLIVIVVFALTPHRHKHSATNTTSPPKPLQDPSHHKTRPYNPRQPLNQTPPAHQIHPSPHPRLRGCPHPSSPLSFPICSSPRHHNHIQSHSKSRRYCHPLHHERTSTELHQNMAEFTICGSWRESYQSIRRFIRSRL